MDIITLPVGKYFNKINPNNNTIIMRDSYNEYIKKDEFKKTISDGYIKLYATDPQYLVNNAEIPAEFISRYCIGTVIEVNENNIKVDISNTIYHDLIKYYTDKSTISLHYPDGLYAGLNCLVVDILGYSDKVNIYGICGFTMHSNETDRSLPDLLFDMGYYSSRFYDKN